jgi:hypothetical protein
MAITPKTLIKSPAVLLGTTVSVLALGAAWSAFQCPVQVETYEPRNTQLFAECAHMASSPNVQHWSETDFVNVAFCYDDAEQAFMAIDVADLGLQSYPKSETLYNIKGYHLIETGAYEEAVSVLRDGINKVQLTSGIMENNLSWASLWVPREMPLETSRTLYQSALKRDTNGINCEAVHTGMWVEYAMAASGSTHVRGDALNRYDALREQYDGCEKRLKSGERHIVEEVLGAAVLDVEVAKLQTEGQRPAWARTHSGIALAKQAMNANTSKVDRAALCEGATPVASTQHTCQRLMAAATRCGSAKKAQPRIDIRR